MGDAGQLILFGLFLVLWAGDSFFIRISTFFSAYLPLGLRLAFLALAFIVAAYLFNSGHEVVSHGQSPERIVSTGAFRFVRHPLYLACILFYLGLTVSTASLFSLLFCAVIFGFYNYIAGYEESLLEAKFGDPYRRYKRKTGKWVPSMRGRDSDKTKAADLEIW